MYHKVIPTSRVTKPVTLIKSFSTTASQLSKREKDFRLVRPSLNRNVKPRTQRQTTTLPDGFKRIYQLEMPGEKLTPVRFPGMKRVSQEHVGREKFWPSVKKNESSGAGWGVQDPYPVEVRRDMESLKAMISTKVKKEHKKRVGRVPNPKMDPKEEEALFLNYFRLKYELSRVVKPHLTEEQIVEECIYRWRRFTLEQMRFHTQEYTWVPDVMDVKLDYNVDVGVNDITKPVKLKSSRIIQPEQEVQTFKSFYVYYYPRVKAQYPRWSTDKCREKIMRMWKNLPKKDKVVYSALSESYLVFRGEH